MARLGASAEATVRQFAGQMDVEAYEAPDGAYSFVLEQSGRLSILATDEGEMIVSLTGRVLLGDLRGYTRLATLGGYDADRDLLVHCGMNRAGQPVLALRTDARAFSLPTLLDNVALLSDRLRGMNG
jgi:hypothetical protein